MTDKPQIPLRLFPFGGVGEFGKNMMVYALGQDAIIVDCGMGFPEPGQHGVDVVIPDISALEEMDFHLHGIVLTHGHEDHIGALPFLLPDLNIPVYGTQITLAVLHEKLAEVKGLNATLRPLHEDKRMDIGPFGIEAIPVTHSIMDAVSIAIHTPHGIVIHTGDFKFDPAPLDGRATALHRFAALGDQGVRLLVSDSTNATTSGSAATERSVGPVLKSVISDCAGKVVVTSFSSNMFRIQQIIDVAIALGRKVALAGRSLERNVGVTRKLGRIKLADDQQISMKQVKNIPADKVLIIAAGSQGESRAALARIASGRFPGVTLDDQDMVVFSSSMIPGNERAITGLFNHIYRRGARVVHAGQQHLHVSGHAHAHELKMMMQLTRPEYFYPVHGEYRNLIEHRHLALGVGIAKDHTIIAENGQSVILDAAGIRSGNSFHAGAVFVDGASRDEIDNMVLRDRRMLAQEGIVTAIVMINRQQGCVIDMPEIEARGLLHQEVGEEILTRAALGLQQHLEQSGQEWLADEDASREEIRLWIRRWFKRQTGKKPLIIPVVLGL